MAKLDSLVCNTGFLYLNIVNIYELYKCQAKRSCERETDNDKFVNYYKNYRVDISGAFYFEFLIIFFGLRENHHIV